MDLRKQALAELPSTGNGIETYLRTIADLQLWVLGSQKELLSQVASHLLALEANMKMSGKWDVKGTA